MNMWYTVIQCTVVLKLSSKDERQHPYTLPIQSLLDVNFWVFHPRDLSPFLIHLTRAFTFHHYFNFFFLFPFHALFIVFILSSHNHDANKCHEVNYPHSQVSPISHKFPTSPNIIGIRIIPKFQNFPTIPIIPIFKYNYFLHTKITKNNQINFK